MESIYRSIQAGTPGAAEARDGLRGLLRRAERWQDLASLLERCIEEEAEEANLAAMVEYAELAQQT